MDNSTIEDIEVELMRFIRRIVLSEKKNGVLDRSAYAILRQLTLYGPAGVKTLSKELHLDVSTISRQAGTLAKNAYIYREPDPADGRAYFYWITESGKRELIENRERRFARLHNILGDWETSDKETFGRLLKKYNQRVEENLQE